LILNDLVESSYNVCKKKNWSRDWCHGGCYLHLEVSEFIESLRGKGSSTPIEEAADIFFVLFSIFGGYHINPDQVLEALKTKIHNLENESK